MNYEKALVHFCKSSPYLKEEYQALKSGFRPVHFRQGFLEEILREHWRINSHGKLVLNLVISHSSRVIISVNQFVSQLKPPTRKAIENKKFLSTKVEVILRAAAKEFSINDDPMTLIEGEENEKSSRKRRYTVESSDCDATQVEDLPGYSPDLKKRHRLNSNSFIYLEGNNDKDGSSNSESSENIPLEELNVNRDLRMEEFDVCVSNNSFIENLAVNINKARLIHRSTPKRAEEAKDDDKEQEKLQEEPSNLLTGNILDELIRNVLEDTDNDPTFHDVIADAVGKCIDFVQLIVSSRCLG